MIEYSKYDEHRIADTLVSKYKCRVFKNEEKPYTMYNIQDIGEILKVSNIKERIQYFNSLMVTECRFKIDQDEYEFFTLQGLFGILIYEKNKKSLDFAKDIGINIESKMVKYNYIDCFECIKKVFSGEEIIEKYTVLDTNEHPYFEPHDELLHLKIVVDLYFPKYKLVVDLYDNLYTDVVSVSFADRRKHIIRDVIEGGTFLIYNIDYDFDLFMVINKIFKHINESNRAIVDTTKNL